MERRVGYAAIPIDIPQLVGAKWRSRFSGAAGSFILIGELVKLRAMVFNILEIQWF
jgi:hypothetical protein